MPLSPPPPQGIRALTQRPVAAPCALTELDVSGSPLGLTGLAQLARLARSTHSLRTLRAVGVAPRKPAGDCASLSQALHWGHWGKVRSLYLDGNWLPFSVLSALLQGAAMAHSLQILSLAAVMAGEGRTLSPAALSRHVQASLLAQLPAFWELAVLDLSSNPLGAALADTPAAAAALLHLKQGVAQPDALAARYAWRAPPKLQTLVLQRCMLTAPGLELLLRGLHTPQGLHTLDISKNGLQAAAVQQLLAGGGGSMAAARVHLDGRVLCPQAGLGRAPADVNFGTVPVASLPPPLAGKRRARQRRDDPVEVLVEPQGKQPRRGLENDAMLRQCAPALHRIRVVRPQQRGAQHPWQTRRRPETLLPLCYLSMTA